jgi:lysophospholipase L1-like esterase
MKYFLALLLLPLSLFASTKVTIIGDSISMGVGATPGHGYVDLLQQRYLNEGKDIALINRSYGRAYTDTLMQIGINTITMDRPDYIVIFLGINDAASKLPGDKLYANFANMIDRCTGNCKRIILGGVNSIGFSASYNETLAIVYLNLINKYDPYPVMLLGPEVIMHTHDGVHPDDVGHQMIADYLYIALQNCGLE